MINAINLIFITLGTFIGAGFASGKEIISFFVKYNYLGIVGIFLTTSLLVVIYFKTVKLSTKYGTKSFTDILKILFSKKNFWVSFLVTCTNIFLLISFFTMVAGFAAFCEQEFNISKFIGTIIILLISFFTLLFDVSGIKKVNFLLLPFIIIFSFVLFAKTNSFTVSYPQINYSLWFIISSILYASYNSIILVPTIVSSKIYISQKHNVISSIILWITIFSLLIAMFFLLSSSICEIENLEIPIMFISNTHSFAYKILCAFMILFSILTSILSASYSFLCDVSKNRIQYLRWLVAICIFGFFSIFVDFSYLVEHIYPVCGIFGLIQLFFLIKT